VSDLAHLPPGLLSLEQWDALELDPTRRWELSDGTLTISPRPQLWHQRISKRLTRLLDDHLPDGLETIPEIEVITRASFPPSVRDPDIVVVPDRVSRGAPPASRRRMSCSSWRSCHRARARQITS
jgi:Uma2 family endonuclease